LELDNFETLNQFSHSFSKYVDLVNPFNQILLSLFDISNAFHNSI